MTEELKRKIGQMLMCGFPSPYADERARRLTEEFYLGNFILFARNFVSCEQTGRMNGELSRLCFEKTGFAPLIAADQEGGGTCRLIEGAALYPGSMAAAAANADTYRLGKNCGSVLSALGVNMNLAPVLDVNSAPMNPIIGSRSFGDTAEKVKRHALGMLKGLTDGGVLGTIKHFPGHGNVVADSHIGIPSNLSDEETLISTDFEPFRAAVESGAEAVMSCHVVFKSVDPGSPATLSKKIMTGLLREKMGFKGIAMTDCLEMGAIKKGIGTGEGAVRAVEAGNDLLCISHTYEAAKEACEALYAAVDSGRISEERINASYERIISHKRLRGLTRPFIFDKAAAEQILYDPERLSFIRGESRKSTVLLKGDPDGIRRLLKSSPVFVSPRQLALTGFDNPEASPVCFAVEAQKRFGGRAIPLPVDGFTPEMRNELENAEAGAYVLGLYNARFSKDRQQALRALEESGKPLIIVLLGEPYDANIIGRADGIIAAFEYSPLSVASVLDALESGEYPGRLPVALA